MRGQFESAHNFFTQHIAAFNASNQNMFKGVHEILLSPDAASSSAKSKKLQVKKTENAPNHDGLSSQ